MSVIVKTALASITTSHNPRDPMPALSEAMIAEGYWTGDNANPTPWSVIDLIHSLALSEDADERAKFVGLVDKYEPAIKHLAASRKNVEIQPVVLRSFRVNVSPAGHPKEYVERFGVVAGERRILACAYSHALDVASLPELDAISKKLTVAEAFDLAVEENAQRLEMTDLEYGKIFAKYRDRINPDTEKNFTLKEIAAKLNLDYQFVRGREALTFLPQSDINRLQSGKLGVTKAIDKGLDIKMGKEVDAIVADKKSDRRRVLPLSKVESLFDENRNRDKNYLAALCDVMQVAYDVAINESDKRAEQAEIDGATKALRSHG